MRSIGFSLACILASCAHSPPAAPPSSTSPAELVPSTIALVQEVRGLKARHPIQVQMLDPPAFSKALGALHEPSRDELESLRAAWVAFGLAPPTFDLRASIRGVFDEQVVGFYSPAAKALYVRSQMPDLGEDHGALMTRGVLAHEIEHALQDQLLTPLDQMSKDDEANLARSALVEGDAQLTMLAALAKLNGVSIENALGNMAALTRLGPDTLARVSGFSAKLLEAPAILRETLSFPYFTGLSLAGALWQAGGFDLVNRAFATPPVSTSQVLHPSRYAHDIRPRPIPDPPLPEGWTEKDRGSMGELGTLAVLEQCLARVKAEGNAASLSGDRYLVAARPDGRLGLIWVSTWTSRQAADSFALNMILQEPCWDRSRGDGPGSVGPEVQIQLAASEASELPKWTEMVVLRGVPEGQAKSILATVASMMPGPAPLSKPPFGEGFKLKPVAPTVPSVRHGAISGPKWRDDGLGLAATIPKGWTANTELPGIALVIRLVGTRDSGVYGYIPAALTDALVHQVSGAMMGSLEATVGGGKKLRQESEEKIQHHGTPGRRARWGMDGTDFKLQLLMLPICAGRATAMLATFSHASTEADLSGWLDSFTVSPQAGAACPAQ